MLDLKDISEKFIDSQISVCGWVRNHRRQKEMGFIDLYDGTKFGVLQVVYDMNTKNLDKVQNIKIGSAICVSGKLEHAFNDKNKFELLANDVELIADCDEDFPIQPKRHTTEFLREVAHLRMRTNLYQAICKERSKLAYAIHNYFNTRGYTYVHTPILTANDGEGAGNTFQVTTLLNNEKNCKELNFKEDFFGKKAFLAVTGQLEGETFAMAFKKIYTFGPTFRAENSNTKTHAAEFWMIEPEIAFCHLDELIKIEEDFLVNVIKEIKNTAKEELEFFDKFVSNGLLERLSNIEKGNFPVVSYKQAVEILEKHNDEFKLKAAYGEDIGREHEKFLTEKHFKSPVFIKDWPKEAKAFYMKLNDDNKTVAAVDLIVPNSGELMGGSEREVRLELLEERMRACHIPQTINWYKDLRRYGGCFHSGFGMGFERLIMLVTGVDNIRDVLPYFRTPGNCDF